MTLQSVIIIIIMECILSTNQSGGMRSPSRPTPATYSSRQDNDGPHTSLGSPPLLSSSFVLDSRSRLGFTAAATGVMLPRAITAASLPEEECEEEEEGVKGCGWEGCGQDFPDLQSLVNHLDRDHTLSMVKYICLWKDCIRSLKPFDARYKLVTHLRCHTGEKPYKCEVGGCPRSFSRLENLKLHVRTHTGEKPYVCHYEGCNKRFNNTSDRAKHMKTHITRKPYICRYLGCSKSYTDPSSMRKHVKFAHKLKERDSFDDTLRISPERSPRKQSTSSSSSSSSPQTPRPPATIVLQKPINTIAISPFNSTAHSTPKAVHVYSPPPSLAYSASSSSPVAASFLPVTANLGSPAPTTPSIVPVPAIFHMPSPACPPPVSLVQPVQQTTQPVFLSSNGTQQQQQQVVMFIPGMTMAMNASQTSPQKLVSVSPSPGATTLLSNGEAEKHFQWGQLAQDVRLSNGSASPCVLYNMINLPQATALLPGSQHAGQGGGGGAEGRVSSRDSDVIEQQLQMNIAQLQRELALRTQQRIGSTVIPCSIENSLLAQRSPGLECRGGIGGSTISCQSIASLIAPSRTLSAGIAEVTAASQVQAQHNGMTATARPLIATSSSISPPLLPGQSLAMGHHHLQAPAINGFITAEQLTHATQPVQSLPSDCPPLNLPTGGHIPSQATLGINPLTKNVTLVNPMQILNLNVAPRQSSPVILSNYVLPTNGSQMVVQQPTGPQVIRLTTLSTQQGDKKS